jgi:hypothetical protein
VGEARTAHEERVERGYFWKTSDHQQGEIHVRGVLRMHAVESGALPREGDLRTYRHGAATRFQMDGDHHRPARRHVDEAVVLGDEAGGAHAEPSTEQPLRPLG